MLNYSHEGAEDVKRTVVVIDTTAPSIAPMSMPMEDG